MSLREWLESTMAAQATPTPVPISDPISVSPPATDSATDPTPEPPRVRPIPPIGSPEYRRAPLGRKFWIATSVRLPEMMPVQRELQTMARTPGFDPWAAAELLRRIEAFVRERDATSP